MMLRNLTRKQKLAQIPPKHASFDRKVNMQVYNRSEHIWTCARGQSRDDVKIITVVNCIRSQVGGMFHLRPFRIRVLLRALWTPCNPALFQLSSGGEHYHTSLSFKNGIVPLLFSKHIWHKLAVQFNSPRDEQQRAVLAQKPGLVKRQVCRIFWLFFLTIRLVTHGQVSFEIIEFFFLSYFTLFSCNQF